MREPRRTRQVPQEDAEPGVSPSRNPGFLSAPLRGRTWRELAHVLMSAVVGTAGFCYVVSVLAIGGALSFTLIGVPLLVLGVLGARGVGVMERARARALLRVQVENPARFTSGGRLRDWLLAGLRDAAGWRVMLYLLLLYPWALCGFVLTFCFWGIGLYYVTAPVWWRHVNFGRGAGVNIGAGPNPPAHTISVFGSYYIDDWHRVLMTAGGGLVLIWLAPWVTHAFALGERWLVRTLLGPTQASERIRTLERSRGQVVDDAAAKLRRIERDLHDGAQARLVSLAMNLGMAKERLAATDETVDPDALRTRELVAAAHRDAKAALIELRDLARGIHPPVLDAGLEPALATLASRSAIPTELRVELDRRPARSIETIAYYCVAELLTNAAKHSGANHVNIHVLGHGDRILLAVSDDGFGGASATRGGGLAGLVGRVRAVDGDLDIESPAGGPTIIAIDLPWSA